MNPHRILMSTKGSLIKIHSHIDKEWTGLSWWAKIRRQEGSETLSNDIHAGLPQATSMEAPKSP